jgi:sugar lactone lactonase YvrE
MPSQKTWTRRKILLSAITGAFAIGYRSLAQDNISTPTLGPTKTPSATPAAASTPPPTQTGESSTTFQSLTQADLSVLTANVQRPNGIAWHQNSLYTACSGDGTVYEINSETGQTRTLIGGVRNAHTIYPEGEDDALNLWVPDFGNNTFACVTRNGVDTILEGLNGPWGIAYEDEQNFLITNLLGNTLIRVNRDGEAERLDQLTAPTGIVLDGDIIYVANNGSTRRAIEWYDLNALDNNSENHVLVSGLQNTTGLQLGSDGYLYFAYAIGTRGVVGRVYPQTCRENGGCTNEEVEVVVFTELPSPLAGLNLAPDMRLFLHTMFVPDIYWVQLPNGGNSAAEQ